MEAEAQPFIFNPKHNSQQIIKILQALKQASHQLHQNPSSKTFSTSPSIKALLELEHESDSILSNDPNLTTLSSHLTALKTLTHKSNSRQSFLTRRVNSHEISKLAGLIESEIDRWIGRELVQTLTETLRTSDVTDDVILIDVIRKFVELISKGFDRDLQDSILRSKVFTKLETVLCNGNGDDNGNGNGKYSKEVREAAALAITELIRFNKDVFVGQVLIGETVRALIELLSVGSLQTLSVLIRYIKSPIIDEMESNGEIGRIVKLLTCDEVMIRVMAMECVMEIGYFGRKEAIEAMLEADLVKKLVELQRSEIREGSENNNNNTERHPFASCVARFAVQLEVGEGLRHPFASCVARFAVQLEVGEGLRRREKSALKQEVLRRVRDAHVCEAEAATIIAEVLWGASP